MRKALLGMAVAVAALGTASASQASTTISFGGTGAGDIGVSQKNYGGVIAYGCANLNTCATARTDLYEKLGGGDENGVGLSNDPSTNGEIWLDVTGRTTPAVGLDVTAILGAATAQFIMGSTTGFEVWNVLGWNGSAWINLLSGTADNTPVNMPGWGTYQFYAFTSGGTQINGQTTFGNVLLSALVVSDVPEPSTWAMMLLGFGAIGFAMRRRPTGKIAQVA